MLRPRFSPPLAALVLLPLALAAAPGRAAEKGKGEPAPTVTSHEVTIGERRLAYRATAGRLPLKTEGGDLRAHVFFVAYEQAGDVDPSERPVTFVFNGGPGAASVWLHLGALGPWRVAMSDEGEPPRPPARAVPNPDTWLDFTDLVFVDPVGTGYSRPAGKHRQAEFSGLQEDTEAVGEFVRLWTKRYRRWGSPKYLVGESYGSMRAASLAGYLQERYGMYLNGIVLVSAVLDFATIRAGHGNDLPYALLLPSYTATAAYHGRLAEDLAADLDATLAEVERFALGEYLVALAAGDALAPDRRAAVAERVARYAGLPAAFVDRGHLRVSLGRFAKELLRDEWRTVGRLDSRYTGIDRDALGESFDYDPSMEAVRGPFAAAMKSYLAGTLGYESDLVYEILGSVGRWKFPEGRYPNVTETLRRAMTRNRHLRVLVASGRYDLATPYLAAAYTVRHLFLDRELRDHVRVRSYDAGHMMYLHAPSRRQLKADAAAFFAWAPSPPKTIPR